MFDRRHRKQFHIRYFFHIRDALGVAEDEEGSELPDMAEALIEARSSARDLVIEMFRGGANVHGSWIDIADDQGRVLESINVQYGMD